VRKRELAYAGVFGEVPESGTFWYENSIGLVEVAANRAHAADLLGIEVGDAVSVVD
jgi:S-adenosylmethionine hydrolase